MISSFLAVHPMGWAAFFALWMLAGLVVAFLFGRMCRLNDQ